MAQRVEECELLFIHPQMMQRLKNCQITNFQTTISHAHTALAMAGTKEFKPKNQHAEFKIEGVATDISFEFGNREVVEIVKRIEAYTNLKSDDW